MTRLAPTSHPKAACGAPESKEHVRAHHRGSHEEGEGHVAKGQAGPFLPDARHFSSSSDNRRRSADY